MLLENGHSGTQVRICSNDILATVLLYSVSLPCPQSYSLLSSHYIYRICILCNFLYGLLEIWVENIGELLWSPSALVGGQIVWDLFGQIGLIKALLHLLFELLVIWAAKLLVIFIPVLMSNVLLLGLKHSVCLYGWFENSFLWSLYDVLQE